MPLNEKEMFERIETALKVYYQINNIPAGGQIQVELFINWLYNQSGLVRKGVEHERLDTVPKVGS